VRAWGMTSSGIKVTSNAINQSGNKTKWQQANGQNPRPKQTHLGSLSRTRSLPYHPIPPRNVGGAHSEDIGVKGLKSRHSPDGSAKCTRCTAVRMIDVVQCASDSTIIWGVCLAGSVCVRVGVCVCSEHARDKQHQQQPQSALIVLDTWTLSKPP